MAISIRTRDLHDADRRDTWLRFACETLGPLDVRLNPDVPLRGEISVQELGPVRVGRVETMTPHSVHRTPGLIRRDASETYRVVVAVSGNPVLIQDDRSARLSRGQFASYDFSRPYQLVYESPVRLAMFSFPRELLSLPAGLLSALTATPMGADGGAGALAGPLLSRVAQDLDDYQPASAARLSSVVMNLVTAAVAERADEYGAVPVESREQTLLMGIHSFVEEHLGDESLTPGAIAAAHFISLRYLYRLFEDQQTTVAAWIRHRRLERCRTDLSDPAMLTTPVSAIAARWGLPDPAHFTRLFRATYGMPPAEYRRTSLTAPAVHA